MDLVRCDNEVAATSDLIAAQAVELDDFFAFDTEKVGAPGEALEGVAVRYRVRAELGGRRFEEVMVDTVSDPLKWKPEPIRGQDLLAFADIGPIEVPVLPLEQHVAEKVHAYTRTYGQGQQSSRAKDLVDLVLVKQFMMLDAARLRRALVGVFEGRGQHVLPDRLPPPPTELGRTIPEDGPRKSVSIRIYALAISKPQRFSIQYSLVARPANGIRRGLRGRDSFLEVGGERLERFASEATSRCTLLAMELAFALSSSQCAAAKSLCPILCPVCPNLCPVPMSIHVTR